MVKALNIPSPYGASGFHSCLNLYWGLQPLRRLVALNGASSPALHQQCFCMHIIQTSINVGPHKLTLFPEPRGRQLDRLKSILSLSSSVSVESVRRHMPRSNVKSILIHISPLLSCFGVMLVRMSILLSVHTPNSDWATSTPGLVGLNRHILEPQRGGNYQTPSIVLI